MRVYTLECIPPLFNPTAVSSVNAKDTVVFNSKKQGKNKWETFLITQYFARTAIPE